MDVTGEKDRGEFFLPADLSFLKQVLLRTTSHKTNPVTGQKLGGSRTSHLRGGTLPGHLLVRSALCGVTKGWAGPCHKPSNTPVPSPGTLAAVLMM